MPPAAKTKYEQYKADTAALTTWIARTAINYGWPAHEFSLSEDCLVDLNEGRTAAQIKNTERMKERRARARAAKSGDDGENRPEASDKMKDKSDERNGVAQQEMLGGYTIKVSEWSDVARFIVKRDVIIPIEVIRLLQRCIKIRTKYSGQFLTDPNKRPDESTAAHKHFVEVLEEVEFLFVCSRPDMRKEQCSMLSSGDHAQPKKPNARSSNQSKEEMSDIVLPEPMRPPEPPPVAIPAVLSPQQEANDLIHSTLKFFGEVQEVRRHLEHVWLDYKNRKNDLVTACVITNTALEVLRGRSEEVMSRIMPLFDHDLSKLLWHLYQVMSSLMERGILPCAIPDEDPDKAEVVTASLQEYVLIPNYRILAAVAQHVEPGRIAAARTGFFGTHDTDLDFEELDSPKRREQANILLSETFLEYQLIVAAGGSDGIFAPMSPFALNQMQDKNHFFFDEIAAEMDRFQRTKTISLFLLITSEIFVNIHTWLGRDAARGWDNLQAVSSRMIRSIEEREEVQKGYKLSTWSEDRQLLISQCRVEAMVWSKLDPIQIFAEEIQDPATNVMFTMKKHPFLCGLTFFRLQIMYQNAGLSLANSWGTILSTAHLYLACQNTKAASASSIFTGESSAEVDASPEWPDMDLWMNLHGKQEIFGGTIPRNVAASESCFKKMMGVSEERRRVPGSVRQEDELSHYFDRVLHVREPLSVEPKGPLGRAQIIPIFRDRYLRNLGQVPAVPNKNMDTLLSDITWNDSKATEDNQDALYRVGLISMGRNWEKELFKYRPPRKPRPENYSVIELLLTLEYGLKDEITSLRFDYVSMHTRCWRLLQKIRTKLGKVFTEKVGTNRKGGAQQLPRIVWWILHCAAESAQASTGHIGNTPSGVNVDLGSKPLMEAALSLREFLKCEEEKGGTVEEEKMTAFIDAD